VVILGCALANKADRRAQFSEFLLEFSRQYDSVQEQETRYQYFVQNMEEAERLAAMNPHATFGYNHLSDWSPAELARLRGYKESATNSTLEELPVPNIKAAEAIDWRAKGKVSAVKDQGRCGSCWAFSATEEIESMWAMKGHAVPELSPQQIVSCDTSVGGCNGGGTKSAYEYVESAGGIESESSYPYVSGQTKETGTCDFKSSRVFPGLKVTGYNVVGQHDEETMAVQMNSVGPLSVCVDASSWGSYKGGVLTSCGTQIDHCVQAVGYNKTASPPYWIVRNSWGTRWGENGYILLAMGKNVCGLSNGPTIALLS